MMCYLAISKYNSRVIGENVRKMAKRRYLGKGSEILSLKKLENRYTNL